MPYLNFSVASPINAKIIAIIQNRITIVDSAHPFFSKWWCIGAILKILLPVNLKEATCIMTETVSKTNRPPIIAKTISCFTIIAIAASEPPKDRDPVSPIKIFAGGALYQRKPKQAPTTDPQKIDQLPDTKGLKNEFIIHRSHKTNYDHNYRNAGAKLIEIGNTGGTYTWELESNINENTDHYTLQIVSNKIARQAFVKS